MNKQEILKQYPKEDDKFLVAKVLDKIQATNGKHQVQTTDFLDGYQQKLINKVLQQLKYLDAIFYGGYGESERKMVFFFPEKLKKFMQVPITENNIIKDLIQVISITLPTDLKGKYHHKDYLSGLMKLGVKREKIGDILVREEGADILVQKDIISYLLVNLSQLTRFRKAKIDKKSILELNIVPIKKEEITILVPQLRLDTIIAELINSSRTKANEIILQERALINYEIKTKNSIILKQGDLLTIRGKGKFQIGEVIGETSKGNLKVLVEKYTS